MRRWFGALVALFVLSSLVAPARAQLAPRQPVDYVDPMIGTLAGGFAYPGPDAPFGMVQVSPDTEGPFAYTGYQYADTSIRGFSHHHIESMGVRSNGDLPFMPTVGPVNFNDPRAFMSPFDHATEEAEPGYYRVLLERYGIEAELTSGRRVAMHRYTFPPTTQGNVIFDVGQSNDGYNDLHDVSAHHSSFEIVDEDTVAGTSFSPQGYDIHFVADFDRPFASFGTWNQRSNGPITPSSARQADGVGAGGYVSFDATGDRDVVIKVGISFVSRQNARLNLDSEQPDFDFDALRAKTRQEWADALSTITVDGGTDAEKTSFYTALYHAQQHPNVYNDVNGEYMGYDNQVHTVAGRDQYANFSLWDTLRGENQLLATIQPERYRQMMLSLLDGYGQVGRFPQWAMDNAYPDYMDGDPVQPTIVDGYCRGLIDPDKVDAFYDALHHQAFDRDVRRGMQGNYDDYLDLGWIRDQASNTLEFAMADFALAVMADSLGHDADRDELLARADNYANVIDPSIGFARPRHADGTWLDPYQPEEPDHFKEGTGWQYTWLAPQDFRGLFDIVGGSGRGGDAGVRDRLDTFFSTPASDAPAVAEAQKSITFFGVAYAGNQYAPSNEHDLQAPYVYDYIGQPWKTQKIMRGLQALYRPTPDGMPGNDDLGSMSAWFVWSALGFNPETPGAPVFAVGSPLFEHAAIAPVGGDAITIDAPGASVASKYVQSARLGTEVLDRPWFTNEQLADAGSVTFEMGPLPNEAWGAGEADAPPSMTGHAVSDFGCPHRSVPEPAATNLTYTGATRAKGSAVTLAARLTSGDQTLAGQVVTFRIAGQSLQATTGTDGVATVTASVPDHGRTQTVNVSFAGSAAYAPAEATAIITWGSSGS
ncbi:MAG TPA: GH92 family glycosyl hydrolase [Actinomycetota bacterium]|nr:GH92 family glycosyl hydrolase [Actinomycetota bacterium]